MEYVTIVNRTSKPLEAIWDGRRYELKPGKNSLPDLIARKAMEQNPILGTETIYSIGNCQSLLGVVEWNNDCSPLEQSDAIERLDRSKLGGVASEAVVVRGDTGIRQGYGARAQVARDQSLGSTFVKP
jgi:hypothetical protein